MFDIDIDGEDIYKSQLYTIIYFTFTSRFIC